MHDGLHQFERNDVSLVPHPKMSTSLTQSGSSVTRQMKKRMLLGTRPNLLLKVIHNLKELTLMKHLPQLLGLNPTLLALACHFKGPFGNNLFN